jgi:hypothetical protein
MPLIMPHIGAYLLIAAGLGATAKRFLGPQASFSRNSKPRRSVQELPTGLFSSHRPYWWTLPPQGQRPAPGHVSAWQEKNLPISRAPTGRTGI